MKLLLVSVMVLMAPVLISRSALAEEPSSCKESLVVEAAVAPEFPEVARKARAFGTTYVTVEVNESGVVTKATDAPKLPSNPLFQPSAIEAAKRWRFKKVLGCATRTATLTFDFKQAIPRGWGAGTIFEPPFSVVVLVEEIRVEVEH